MYKALIRVPFLELVISSSTPQKNTSPSITPSPLWNHTQQQPQLVKKTNKKTNKLIDNSKFAYPSLCPHPVILQKEQTTVTENNLSLYRLYKLKQIALKYKTNNEFCQKEGTNID